MSVVHALLGGSSALFVACAAGALAQDAGPAEASTGPRLAPALFADVTWRNIGPSTIGGRVDRIAVARRPGAPDQIYIIGNAGGAFRSTNGGASWSPIFDAVNGAKSMGDIEVAPSNPNVLWIGTGEETNVAYYWGDGVYKSTDGGATWTNMGLGEARHTGRIAIHPTNPDIVFVAAEGRLWGSNSERGVFKTTDGGRTWKKVLFIDDNTGANDILFDPSNPEILYTSTYQRQRRIYGGIGVGPGSGIYKSVDGGNTWTKLTKGLPTVDMGRIGLTVSRADPKLLFADIEVAGARYPAPQGNEGDCPPPGSSGRGGNAFESQGGVFRSTDGGETWTQAYPRSDQPAGYFAQVRADPNDRNRVYRLGLQMYVSDNLGQTFRTVPARLHGDFHDLWIDPADNNHLMVSNDGGLAISWDRGSSWSYVDDLPLAQYWEMGVDNRDPYLVCGGTQDNGNWCVPSASRNRNGISSHDVFTVGGGDGMHFHVDPFDTTYAFIQTNSVTTTSSLVRLNLTTLQRENVRPGSGRPINCYDAERAWSKGGRGLNRGVGDDPSYRWAWDAPLLFSSVTPGVVYMGANVLFKSTDHGGSWRPISGDLTGRENRDTIFVMGQKIGVVNYSPGGGPSTNPLLTSLYGAISWISESPLNTRVLYTGSDDGQVFVTRDGGAHWTNVTSNVPGLPPHSFVSTVLASAHAPGRVYATFDGHFNDDENTYVFVSDDYGQSWRKIVSGLPKTSINRIAEHPRSPNLLVVGHAYGVHFSNDRGQTWHSLATNMPTVPVRSIVFQARDNALIAGSYARGAWIIDDVSPLEKLTAATADSAAIFISATRGREWNTAALGTHFGVADFYAPNPSYDPIITYYLHDAHSGGATVTISDASGRQVRKLQGPASAGLNHLTWDMRMDQAIPAEAAQAGGRRGGGGGGGGGGEGRGAATSGGPIVLPGEYSVRVTIAGIAAPLRGNVTVSGDAHEALSSSDRTNRQATLTTLYELQKTLVAARSAVEELQGKMEDVRRDVGSGGAAATQSADSIARNLSRTHDEFARLLSLASAQMREVEGFSTAASAEQRQQITWATDDAIRAIGELNRTSQTTLPSLYARYAHGAKPPAVQRVAPPTTSGGKSQ
jgi:photosystem II stability/assembly factor-like uncharacterized protein